MSLNLLWWPLLPCFRWLPRLEGVTRHEYARGEACSELLDVGRTWGSSCEVPLQSWRASPAACQSRVMRGPTLQAAPDVQANCFPEGTCGLSGVQVRVRGKDSQEPSAKRLCMHDPFCPFALPPPCISPGKGASLLGNHC